MHILLSAAITIIYLMVLPAIAVAQSMTQSEAINSRPPALEMVYDGITVIGNHPPTGTTYDVPILGPDKALLNISNALALIKKKSPFSTAKIEALINNGFVVIIYDPQFPNKQQNFATLRVAAFFPYFSVQDDNATPRKNFPVLISRHGIKWPVRELASVIVHELVGHGIQHLEGRLDTMRNVDSECEAWLYEEMAHQDFGMDKFSDKMIRFKKELIFNCDGFLRHLRENDPVGLAVWKVLNPDVPELLVHFENYLEDLRERGTMQEALQFSRKLKNAELEKLFREGSPEDHFKVAMLYRDGIGFKPDMNKAANWFQKAAEQGHSIAQINLANLYAEGNGVIQDYVETAKWYRMAANQKNAFAQYKLGLLYLKGKGVSRDIVLAHMWLDLGAVNGNTSAAKVRDALAKGMPAEKLSDAQKRVIEWKPDME